MHICMTKIVKPHEVNLLLAGFSDLKPLHCVAEAETEAAVGIAGDEVHAWSYYYEINRLTILRKSLLGVQTFLACS